MRTVRTLVAALSLLFFGPRGIAAGGCNSECSSTALYTCSLGFCTSWDLDLHDKALFGTIPVLNTAALTAGDLDLSNNQLSGSIPEWLCTLSSKFFAFDMSSNLLTGTLPVTISQLTNINNIEVDNNKLTGFIPDTLGVFSHGLSIIAVQSNNLIGTIPSVIGSLTSLKKLKVASNQLTGTLAPALGSLRRLTSFDIANNAFTGTVPVSLCSILDTATSCSMSSNAFDCPLPCASTMATCGVTCGAAPASNSSTITPVIPPGEFIGIIAASGAVLAAAIGIAWVVVTRRKKLLSNGSGNPVTVSMTNHSASKLLDGYLPDSVSIDNLFIPADVIDFGSDSDCIAHGGGGRVYRCNALKASNGLVKGQAVALKEVYSMLARTHSPETVREFGKEMAALVQVRHKNIVRFFGVYQQDASQNTVQFQRFLLVMEYAANGSMADHIVLDYALESSPSVARRHQWLVEIAEAVEYLHSQRYVHRDLKPQNVLLDAEWRCLLTDFGISREMGQEGMTSQQNPLTKSMGTLQFMPPEALSGSGGTNLPPSFTLATAWDTFSFALLCVTAFRCTVVPFPNTNERIIIAQMATDDLRPEIPEHILGPEYVAFIKQMWHNEPNSRPAFATIVQQLKHLTPSLSDGVTAP